MSAQLHWLRHCGSWFGFASEAAFVAHKDGGYFADAVTGEPVRSIIQNGTSDPRRGIALGAGGEHVHA